MSAMRALSTLEEVTASGRCSQPGQRGKIGEGGLSSNSRTCGLATSLAVRGLRCGIVVTAAWCWTDGACRPTVAPDVVRCTSVPEKRECRSMAEWTGNSRSR